MDALRRRTFAYLPWMLEGTERGRAIGEGLTIRWLKVERSGMTLCRTVCTGGGSEFPGRGVGPGDRASHVEILQRSRAVCCVVNDRLTVRQDGPGPLPFAG